MDERDDRRACCVEIFVPLRHTDGTPAPPGFLTGLQDELTRVFGGVTAFLRSPAQGRWADDGEVVADDIVIFEVMAADLDRDWWSRMRQRLEDALGQREILIRAHPIERL